MPSLQRRLKSPPSRRSAVAERAPEILRLLERAHPEATCALDYRNPYELLIATILSAQCTDRRVNEVAPALFRRYPSPDSLSGADLAEVEQLIRSTGFYRSKAKSLVACAQAVVREHGGSVPGTMDALVRLPGVGRKTANVVLGHAFQVAAGMAVDTHVLRVAVRLGLASAQDAEEVERQLLDIIPRTAWTRASDLLIFHGRKVCAARKPACERCPVLTLCRWPGRGTVVTGKRDRPATR